MVRRAVRDAVFALLVLAALAAGAEAVLRLATAPTVESTYFELPEGARNVNREDPDLFWAPVDDFDVDRVRAYAGRHLIYGLGGSIAAGCGCDENYGFNQFVERRVKEAYPDAMLGLLALGGYTSHQSRVNLDRFAAIKRPWLVVFCNAFNDASRGPLTFREVQRRNHHWTRRLLFGLNRSRAFVALKHAVRRGRAAASAGGGRSVPLVPLADYRDNVRHMIGTAARAGAPIVLVTQAMPIREDEERLDPYFRVLAELAAAHPNALYVDVRPAFLRARERLGVPYLKREDAVRLKRRRDYSDALFDDGCCHPSRLGHSLIADAILDALRGRGLLGGPTPGDGTPAPSPPGFRTSRPGDARNAGR